MHKVQTVIKQVLIGGGLLGLFVLYSLGMRGRAAEQSAGTSLKTASPSSAPAASSNSTSTGVTPSPSQPASAYKSGSYTGSVEDAFYGNVQVSVDIRSGKLTTVTFLQYPDTHSTSVMINQQAMPYLKQEVIAAQSANVQIISGATFTSEAFIKSLTTALSKAS